MVQESKHHIVTRIVDRLADRYPDAPRPQVEVIVEEEYDTLDDGRIRTYIPTLVEHSARDRISTEFARRHRDH
jgi:hypothetical protein